MLVASVSITIQIGATMGLSAIGVPVSVSFAIGEGLSNLAGQATSWGLGMQAPGHQGIDWGNVVKSTVEGALFSSVTPLGGVLAQGSLAARQERLRGLDERPRHRWLAVQCWLRRTEPRARRAEVWPVLRSEIGQE